jgi:hypothetical protein
VGRFGNPEANRCGFPIPKVGQASRLRYIAEVQKEKVFGMAPAYFSLKNVLDEHKIQG